jgi:hypothetical protein
MSIGADEVEARVDTEQRAAILATAVDYIESWLDGDAERMAHCLHRELVKRSVAYDADGSCRLVTVSQADMVSATAQGYGRRYERPYDATVLDAFGDIATVRVFSSVYMDYLHVARIDGRWQLVNVLWQRRPDADPVSSLPAE